MEKLPDWKNYTVHVCSCPRDWRLSSSWGAQVRTLQAPLTASHYGIEGFIGDPKFSPHYIDRR